MNMFDIRISENIANSFVVSVGCRHDIASARMPAGMHVRRGASELPFRCCPDQWRQRTHTIQLLEVLRCEAEFVQSRLVRKCAVTIEVVFW